MKKIIIIILSSFSIGYFFTSFLAVNRFDIINDSNKEELYFVLKKEKLEFTDDKVINFMEKRRLKYEELLEKNKNEIDKIIDKKRLLVKSNLPFDITKDGNCDINTFIKKAIILEKTDLANQYKNLQKAELPECNLK